MTEVSYIIQSEGNRHFAFLAKNGQPFGPKLGPYRSREAAEGIARTMIRIAADFKKHPPAANQNGAEMALRPRERRLPLPP